MLQSHITSVDIMTYNYVEKTKLTKHARHLQTQKNPIRTIFISSSANFCASLTLAVIILYNSRPYSTILRPALVLTSIIGSYSLIITGICINKHCLLSRQMEQEENQSKECKQDTKNQNSATNITVDSRYYPLLNTYLEIKTQLVENYGISWHDTALNSALQEMLSWEVNSIIPTDTAVTNPHTTNAPNREIMNSVALQLNEVLRSDKISHTN